MIARTIWVALKLYSENNYHIVTIITLQSLSFGLEAYIEPGEPSDRCPRGFIYEPSGPYCKGMYIMRLDNVWLCLKKSGMMKIKGMRSDMSEKKQLDVTFPCFPYLC